MSRLSNYVREQMARALVDHRFADRVSEQTAESRALFKLVYEQHHDADVRKHMAAIVKKNRDAFNRVDSLRANVGGQRIDVGAVSVGSRWKVEAEYRPALRDATEWNGIAVDGDLAKRVIAFAEASKALGEEASAAEREALGALQQFSTGKKLADEWPEAMPIIGDLIPENDRTLPVVQVGKLNATFKLPTKLAKAA